MWQSKLNTIIQGDCLEVMKDIPDNSVDLVVTSPPYDNLRDYKGYEFNFKGIAKQLYRIIKVGGVVVWIVGDSTNNGTESGESFRQALYFKEIGFNLHDTMIYEKDSSPYPPGEKSNRYNQIFEYMFIISKGPPKTINLIKDKLNKYCGKNKSSYRQKNGSLLWKSNLVNEIGIRNNIWFIPSGYMKSTRDEIAFEHPAIFPEALARDHILSWSNPNDIVLDQMCGSGTTCKMAIETGRNFIGIEINPEYCEIAEKRIKLAYEKKRQRELFK